MIRSSVLKKESVPSVIITKGTNALQLTTIIKLVKCGDCYVSNVIVGSEDFLIVPSGLEQLQSI